MSHDRVDVPVDSRRNHAAATQANRIGWNTDSVGVPIIPPDLVAEVQG